MVFFLLLVGYFQTNPSNADFSGGVSLKDLGGYLQQNTRFLEWQLLWWLNGNLETGIFQFASPRVTLLFDFALIATYAYVLSWLVVRAFARIAGLRRAGDGAEDFKMTWLNRLGWALPLAVFSDVAENVMTLVVIQCISANWQLLGKLSAVAMSVFTASNLIGLLGVLVLLIWSLAVHVPTP